MHEIVNLGVQQCPEGRRIPSEMTLAPLLVEKVLETIRRIHDDGTTILLVEQNARAALSIADRAYVLEVGRIALEGTSRQLLRDDSVRKAYLGGR